MTALNFLNHVDQRRNPRHMSEPEAQREVTRRGLRARHEKMARDERAFLIRLGEAS